MPADGTTNGARSDPLDPPPATLLKGRPSNPPREPAGGQRRHHSARFKRFIRIAHAVTLASQITPVLALSRFVPAGVALSVGVVLAVFTVWRLQSLVRGQRRSPWVSVLIDEPALGHWSAAMLSTLLLPVVLVMVGVASAIQGAHSTFLASLRLAALLSYVGAGLVAGWGIFIRRRWVRIVHVEVPVVGLPREFDGYRIAQVSDLHIGNFDPLKHGLAWAARVNALDADLVAVTGDLVTAGTEFYPDVAEVIGAMRGKDGVFVVLGNHDQWDPDLLTRLIRERGARVLRNQGEDVQRGEERLHVAGIDDPMTGKADLETTLAGRRPGAPTVLLSHYPDFFDEAAKRGVALTLSGHTHGGQVAVPFAVRRWSLSTLARQQAYGLHVRDKSRLYVNAGLGTTGPPLRVGIPPEIAVLVLRSR